jgi:hypothetical protein
MVGTQAIVEDGCQGKNSSPREVFKYGSSKFLWPRGLSVFQHIDMGFHLVRENLDDERVVGAEGMIRGCSRK